MKRNGAVRRNSKRLQYLEQGASQAIADAHTLAAESTRHTHGQRRLILRSPVIP